MKKRGFRSVAPLPLILLVFCRPGISQEPLVVAEPETNPKVMPVEKFFKEMQLLARRVPVGKTKFEKEDSLAELRKAIHETFDDVIVEYDVRITSVDWKNGMASIKTQPAIDKYKPSRRLPFKITALPLLVIPMSRAEAVALPTRKPLVFQGLLSLREGGLRWNSRPPKSQSIFWVRHEDYKHVLSIGTFFTEDYSVRIGKDLIFSVHRDPEGE